MPNIWTHNLFGEQLVQKLELDPSLIAKHQTLFNLGCQGPDFLLYHHFLPWQKDQRMPELGGRMHREHCGPVLADFFTRLQDIEDAAQREQAFVYFLGFLTHHILDRNFHPYVHCKAGYMKWAHQRFEVILDTLMMAHFKGIETWRTPVWKEIDAGPALPQAVIAILARTASAWYEEAQEIPEHYWQDAYRDMLRAQKLFHDPYGWKRVVTMGQMEAMVYKKNNPPRDYLNEAKAAWQHPAVEDEASTDSVWDLWEQSFADAEHVIPPLLRWLNAPESTREQSRQSFIEALGNRSYDTGKSCETGLEVRFSQPIWDT